MSRLPERFYEEYDARGESFFEMAELLYTHHGRQFTQQEMADEIGVSQSRVSDFTTALNEGGWIDRHNGETTFVWNTEAHNPAETEITDAVFGLYGDLWWVFKEHLNSSTGIFAVSGFAAFVAGTVLWIFYIAFQSGLAGESTIPSSVYLGMGLGFWVTGAVITVLAPLVALFNRLQASVWRRLF